MTSEELEIIFGPAKVAELTESGHWPVPEWLLPYILNPNPTGPLEFETPEAEQAYRDLETFVSIVVSLRS